MLGKILGGRYELLEKIGGGGMAIVYKAKCHLLKRFVAVKVLRPELVENEEFVSRFKRESQSAASLSHPNIVNIYDVGEENDIHYIVMEYIDGKTLKEYIHEKGKLGYEEAVKICIQICSALSHAHRNKIVHRDIKPQNILLSREGTVKVADFGIARAVSSATVTIAGANVMGSVHYFSPEQARGGFVDKKSDIYSLGIVLYEMVTGVVPFEGDSAISVALKHIQEKVTPPGEINPSIPRSVRDIICKAIEKDANARYGDADQMMSDLKRSLKDPDGDFVYAVSEDTDDQATRVVPVINVEDGLNEAGSQKDAIITAGGSMDDAMTGNDSENDLDYDDDSDDFDSAKQRKPKNKRNMLLVIGSFVIVFGVLLVLILLVRAIWLQNFVSDEVEVPMIEGLSEESASDLLRSKGLFLNVIERRYDNEILEGVIIEQNPKQGMMVQSDSSVEAVVSEGIHMIPVPSVRNKSQRDAEIELENKGLKVGTPEFVDSDIPSGYVVDQSIAENTEVPEGTEIILTISKGPQDKAVEVGKYTNLTESIAREMILADNLTVGTVRYEPSEEVREGLIIRQDPEPGIYVEKNRKINLWISQGPARNSRKTLEIKLSGGNKESVVVKVIRVSDDMVVYDKEHKVSEGTIYVTIEGKGRDAFGIYIDNILKQTISLDFTK